MGSDLVTVCSGSKHPQDKWRRHPSNDDPQSWTEMCREFEIICDHATRHGVLIGSSRNRPISSATRTCGDLLADFPGGPIRMVLDPANIIEDVAPERQRDVIDQALGLLGDHLALAHAKDRHADGTVAPAGRKGRSTGRIFCAVCRPCGFDGALDRTWHVTIDRCAGRGQFLTDHLERL